MNVVNGVSSTLADVSTARNSLLKLRARSCPRKVLMPLSAETPAPVKATPLRALATSSTARLSSDSSATSPERTHFPSPLAGEGQGEGD